MKIRRTQPPAIGRKRRMSPIRMFVTYSAAYAQTCHVSIDGIEGTPIATV
jgi:hypothetical protein